ncbi:MAG: hypothetical protein MZV64_73845 [Ignavibacteriales bacterium]|nr:hypothetical protein [Ignavibacteriales bacterium]
MMKWERKFLKMMEGMKINIAIQVDGKIASTNASYVDGSNNNFDANGFW